MTVAEVITLPQPAALDVSDAAVTAIGIDPGPVPGIFLARWEPGQKKVTWARAYQCNADAAAGLLGMILASIWEDLTCGQIEEFRTGRGAGSRGGAASQTREMVAELTATAEGWDVRLAVRHSSQAFPWAGDKKLVAAGIWEATAQLPHARAASRHCLYAACLDGGMPDPLSRRTS